MQENLIIPDEIKVGFVKRQDTYTGELGFVVYSDKYGKLKKQKSWEGWRDKTIPPKDFKNEPTSGFVLNRDVGGARRQNGWNARVEKVRVYDPRSFEFEISIPNLLYILQECSAIKAKGLEGDFVYSWSGKELILLPTTSNEYKASTEFTSLQTEKVDKKEFQVGCLYLTKSREEVVYMGKHIWWGKQGPYTYENNNSHIGQSRHIFYKINNKDLSYENSNSYMIESGFAKIAKRISLSPIPQYSDIYSIMMSCSFLSKPVKIEARPCSISEEILYMENRAYGSFGASFFFKNNFYFGSICHQYRWPHRGPGTEDKKTNCTVNVSYVVSLVDGRIKVEYANDDLNINRAIMGNNNFITVSYLENVCRDLYVICENGFEYKLKR